MGSGNKPCVGACGSASGLRSFTSSSCFWTSLEICLLLACGKSTIRGAVAAMIVSVSWRLSLCLPGCHREFGQKTKNARLLLLRFPLCLPFPRIIPCRRQIRRTHHHSTNIIVHHSFYFWLDSAETVEYIIQEKDANYSFTLY